MKVFSVNFSTWGPPRSKLTASSRSTPARRTYATGLRRAFFMLAPRVQGRPELAASGLLLLVVPAHVRKVAVALGNVEAIAHDELGRDPESGVGQVEVAALQALLDEQGADLQGGRV